MHRIKQYRISKDFQIAIAASLVCFFAYVSIYAFRKPFTVGLFEDSPKILGIHFKDALVICQVLGYMASKFYGIKFIAEMSRVGRGKTILGLVGISWIAMFFFAILPSPFNVFMLFINGFSQGMIWGVIFSYVEGRKSTDLIGASLAVSFIFASGFVKSVAKWIFIHFQVTEFWLPFVTGLVFLIPLLLFVYWLEKIPAPSEEDIALRVERVPMAKQERHLFFKEFKMGLLLLIVVYVFLTLFRDIRDNFAAEIWKELGYDSLPSVFTSTEIPITLMVLILLASMMFIKNNAKALLITHYIILAGFFIAGLGTLLFSLGLLSAFAWMIAVGLGLYMGYIPFNCLLFDRLIASFQQKGNVGFLMYLADSFGYLASVAVIVSKTFLQPQITWVQVYSKGVMFLSLIGSVCIIASIFYFNSKLRSYRHSSPASIPNNS